MWIRQNEDESYVMCNSFSYWDGSEVVKVTPDSDKRKNNVGFRWEGNQDVIDDYISVNLKLSSSNEEQAFA